MESIDTLVVGAGVIGLACADALALAGYMYLKQEAVNEAIDLMLSGEALKGVISALSAEETRALAFIAAQGMQDGAQKAVRAARAV